MALNLYITRGQGLEVGDQRLGTIGQKYDQKMGNKNVPPSSPQPLVPTFQSFCLVVLVNILSFQKRTLSFAEKILKATIKVVKMNAVLNVIRASYKPLIWLIQFVHAAKNSNKVSIVCQEILLFSPKVQYFIHVSGVLCMDGR